MLEKEFQYYLDHQSELVKQYDGKFLIIKDQAVIGAYDTEEDAVTEGQNRFELGTFLVQLCEPGENSYTQHFHSRVVFH